ncbi:hypothetical protein PG997_005392 [Apiospora hydei]|uniref:Rhodopsin domain-containing protein n=1 Tax=Apiospora hydei TaxID=1337664 RepID=A0ABR1X4V5_9PEZI
MLIKVSFLLLYRRLFRPVAHVNVMVWVGISLVATFGVAYIVIMPVACSPLPNEHDGWLDLGMATRCGTIGTNMTTARSYFSVLTDIYILIIPLHQVPQLRLSTKRKFGISFIFLTGLLAVAAGLTNLIFRQNKSFFDPADFSWNIVPVYATCMAEINIGLIALSLPVVLAQFVGRLTDLGKSLSSWVRNRRTPPHSGVDDDESYSNLAPEEADQSQQQLPQKIPNATLSGMRKFIRNLQRSHAASAPRASLSGHDVLSDNNSHYVRTFDDLTSADFSYHVQLKAMRDSQSTIRVDKSGGEVRGVNPSRRREYGM